MTFREIDDDLWEIVKRHLPPQKPHIGRPRRDPRNLFNGILYVLTTGCAWSDVPARYGTKSTVHRYHLELCRRGGVPGDPSRSPPLGLRVPEERERRGGSRGSHSVDHVVPATRGIA
ncbi:transposase [Methanoculleus chikugoensis]|uniref:transposase n=1 Tax=Methanoculleus chikugoensis TaxID=118126 RepID=UPI000ACC4FF8|nr:transposase [Methanoculleus chikugoensis]